MKVQTVPQASAPFSMPSHMLIGDDHLLGIRDISRILGVCPVTASKIIKESGRSIVLHRKVYIRESAFKTFLEDMEACGNE